MKLLDNSISYCLVLALNVGFWGATLSAQNPDPQIPQLSPADGEAVSAITQFKILPGLKCRLFAAEPDVANIVAFHRDYQGQVFVCETFRQHPNTGVEDNREHAVWLDDDLQAQSIQDRINYVRKHIKDADHAYTAFDDRIRMIQDTDGNGQTDRAVVFADHFNRLEMGTGAGILSYRDSVYYTCIPDLFLLTDNDRDGVSNERKSLHSGFGVRFAFRGHDMHGLIVGPDGRLYFSIGDRGYNVSPEIHDAASGAVFRCELDGSNLEVVATGLRNPQELAFDDLGNLFTGDNNSDSGDKARWVYVVPGGDSGWRMYYQYLPDRGPFNREKIWYPFSDESPAYIVPPVANVGDGPSGLEYYPGTGFGDDFDGRFFMCDFRGGPSNSGIRSFRSEQQGAFWKLTDSEQPIWGVLATDLDFGSDGKLYVADWVTGWVGENKGRIYSFADEKLVDSTLVQQVQSLLKRGLADQTTEGLTVLLGHADQRIRQEAQFEFVVRNDFQSLKSIALTGTNRRQRVHSIWGLGQLARKRLKSLAATTDATASSLATTSRRQPIVGSDSELPQIVKQLLGDADFEIRAQAAQLAGESQLAVANTIIPLLADENLRVRFYAAMALAKIGDATCIEPVAAMLAENQAADPMIRHGGIMALKHGLLDYGNAATTVQATLELANHDSAHVRVALAIAIRKILASKNLVGYPFADLEKVLKKFLSDSHPSVVLETVRTIHDVPVNELMPVLAQQFTNLSTRAENTHDRDAILRRIISANLRTGRKSNAIMLTRIAADDSVLADRRADALRALTMWMTPPKNDWVLYDWRPIDVTGRTIEDAQTVMIENFAKFLEGPESVAAVAVEAVGILDLKQLGAEIETIVLSDQSLAAGRVMGLRSLNRIEYPNLPPLLVQLQNKFNVSTDNIPLELAAEVADLVCVQDSKKGLELVQKIFSIYSAEHSVKQRVIDTVSRMSDADSADWLAANIFECEIETMPGELRLDIILAAEKRAEPTLKLAAEKYRQRLISATDPSAIFVDTLVGGNYAAGEKIFLEKNEVSCVRCHRVGGSGGAVGPELSDVALKRDRPALLDSIVQPNKVIAEGFGQIKVQTIDGLIQIGLLVSENDQEIRLLDADGKTIVIPRDDVDGIKPGLSSMPDDLVKQLTLRELRDLIEYLANQKTPVTAAPSTEHKIP